jgi:hypothetical protein
MGIMKSIVIQVQDMYCDGFTPIEISEITGLHFSEVVQILQTFGEIA